MTNTENIEQPRLMWLKLNFHFMPPIKNAR